SVRCAAFTTGSLNACTPLLTASTPVIAVHPLANARTSSHAPAAPTAAGAGCGDTTGAGCPPAISVFATPSRIAPPKQPTNAYVGTIKNTPASRTPRRLTIVNTSRIPRHSFSVCGASAGTAETTAPTPDEIPTATVST